MKSSIITKDKKRKERRIKYFLLEGEGERKDRKNKVANLHEVTAQKQASVFIV